MAVMLARSREIRNNELESTTTNMAGHEPSGEERGEHKEDSQNNWFLRTTGAFVEGQGKKVTRAANRRVKKARHSEGEVADPRARLRFLNYAFFLLSSTLHKSICSLMYMATRV